MPRRSLKLNTTRAEQALLVKAAAFADCSPSDLVVSATRRRLAKDLEGELVIAQGDATKFRMEVYANLSPTEREHLTRAAQAAHQSVSEYMLHAAVGDAWALVGAECGAGT